jgi:hypothetical protein
LIVVPAGEPAVAEIPALQVHLLDWRVTGKGSVDCTFTATLAAADGTEYSLGSFDGSSLPMLGLRNPFNRAEAFDQAATDAIDNLFGNLLARNLLPAAAL